MVLILKNQNKTTESQRKLDPDYMKYWFTCNKDQGGISEVFIYIFYLHILKSNLISNFMCLTQINFFAI